MDRALLLFEDKFPCWDEETFALVGENVSSLSELAGDGLLVKDGEGYVLTEKGEKDVRSARSSIIFPPCRLVNLTLKRPSGTTVSTF